MTQEKWVVKIEDVKIHVWAIDKDDAITQALKLVSIEAYKKEE